MLSSFVSIVKREGYLQGAINAPYSHEIRRLLVWAVGFLINYMNSEHVWLVLFVIKESYEFLDRGPPG